MADLFIERCKKCGEPPAGVMENGRVLFRCTKCGRSVDICAENECEMIRRSDRVADRIIPYSAAKKAVDRWNKEEENG